MSLLSLRPPSLAASLGNSSSVRAVEKSETDRFWILRPCFFRERSSLAPRHRPHRPLPLRLLPPGLLPKYKRDQQLFASANTLCSLSPALKESPLVMYVSSLLFAAFHVANSTNLHHFQIRMSTPNFTSKRFQAGSSKVRALAWSCCGKRIASGSDRNLRIHNPGSSYCARASRRRR